MLRNVPIRRKLMSIILGTTGAALLLTGVAFFTYEVYTFKEAIATQLSTLAQVLANNSTFALVFKNKDDASEVLSALKAEPHVVVACLYDENGRLFATYPRNVSTNLLPTVIQAFGPQSSAGHLYIFQPVVHEGKRRGVLYIRSDMGGLYDRLKLYALIVLGVMAASLLIAFLLSRILQKQISSPVLALAETARAISGRRDYSVRAPAFGNKDEFGLLTTAFNDMLEQIHRRDLDLQAAHQTLEEHARDLEKRVAERTARLTETITELESFSYSISHDMRAPLRAMQGYSAYLLENASDKLDAEQKMALARISRGASRLDNLIQDILSYSRLARAQIELHPVDLEKLLEDVIQQYPGFQEPQAEIHIKKPLHGMLAHEASLVQVLSNLLGNAVKFVRPGQKPVLEVWTELRDTDVRLWVSDNGIGIPEKDRQRIFGIFERVHATKDYEGTGIGLSIVRKSIERMGGSVGLESELGTGSRFWIQLKRS